METKTKRHNLIFLLVLLMALSTKISAQEFYLFVGKSVNYLTDNKGKPDFIKNNGTSKIYQYLEGGNSNIVFNVTNGNVNVAMKGIKSTSATKAKELSSIQILYYMSLGFNKQGSEAGMTILKKDNRVLSIGYMIDPDGSYSTMITAL